MSAIQVSAVGYLPMGRGGIFGRVGVEQVEAEGTVALDGMTQTGSDTETGIFYGIGGYLNLTENVDLRLEYQKHEVDELDFDTMNAGFTVNTF